MVLLLTTVISCLVQLFSLSLKQSINSLFELTSQPPCQLFSDVKMLMDLLGTVVCMYVGRMCINCIHMYCGATMECMAVVSIFT